MIYEDVRLRCWGLDDPRAIKDLARENDPGRSPHGRTGVVEDRARAAGWPELHTGISGSRQDVTGATHALTGMDLSFRATMRDFLPHDQTIYDE